MYPPDELAARVAARDARPPDPDGRYTLVVDESIAGWLHADSIAALLSGDPGYRPG